MEKIRVKLEGDILDAYKAVFFEYESCGKAAKFPDKVMKLSDETFRCVYEGVNRALSNQQRYPKKLAGNIRLYVS